MWRIKTYQSAYDITIGFLAIIIILAPKLIAIGLIGLLILVSIGVRKKELEFKLDKLSIALLALYVLYVFYALFTRHSAEAFGYFEKKLSLVVFPLLLSFRLKQAIDYKRAIYLFLFAVLILLVTSVIHSIQCFMQDGGVGCFLASIFSYQHHPTYTAVFFFFAMAVLIYSKTKQVIQAWIMYLGLALLFLASLMCLSLSGLLILMACLGVLILLQIRRFAGKGWMYISIVIIPFLLYGLILSIPQLEGEWTNATWYAREYAKNPTGFFKGKDYPLSGTEVRLAMWTASTDVFVQFPFGVGTGNVDEVLGAKLRGMNMPVLASQNYNPHNQYLQTGVEIGVLGVIVLLYICIGSIRQGLKSRNWLLVAIAANLSINMLFESMLQRQSGIVFYCFIICLLTNLPGKESPKMIEK